MSDSKLELKDPMFAAVLAFLVPGLGHFYQRRIFKGLLYCVCILGTFFTGMRIGHGHVVYFNWDQSENRTYPYLCQFWVGAPALPALIQYKLRATGSYNVNFVPREFTATFTGQLDVAVDAEGTIAGQVTVRPGGVDAPKIWIATLTGTITTADGTFPIEGEFSQGSLDPEIAASSQRMISGFFDGQVSGDKPTRVHGHLKGHIPRPFWNTYEVPLQDPNPDVGGREPPSELSRIHEELGSHFELGVVYTMIAGLLNILAIFDCLEGPAYEFDDKNSPPTPPPEPAKT